MRPRKPLLLAVPLAALAIAGCGGGGDDTTASTPTTTETTTALSKEELIDRGDAICAEVNAAVGSVGSNEPTDVQGQIIQVSELYTGMIERLEGLGAPEDKAGYAEFMAAAEELAKVESEVKLAAEREDTAALGEAATKATPALEEFEAAAGEYGFEKCSEGPTAPTPSSPAIGSGEEEAPPVEGSPEAIEEEVTPEVEEEVTPETGGAGGGVEEAAPEGGGTGAGTGGGETGGSSGGIGPG